MKKDVITSIRENWAVIMTIVAMIIAWATLSAKVEASAQEVSNVRTLIERVIVLEEHDSNLREDILEIKQDLKEIKVLVR